MSTRKLKRLVRKSASRSTADAKRIRFGGGMAPAALSRNAAPGTQDTRRIRFGGGMISAALKK